MSLLAEKILDFKNVDVLVPWRLGHETDAVKIKRFIEKINPQLRIGEFLFNETNDVLQVNAVFPFTKMAPIGAKKVLPPLAWRWLPDMMPRAEMVLNIKFLLTHVTAMACFHFIEHKAATPEFQKQKDWNIHCWSAIFRKLETDQEGCSHVAYRVICIAEDQEELTPEQTEDLKYILSLKPERLPVPRSLPWKAVVYSVLAITTFVVAYCVLKSRFPAWKPLLH